MEQRRFSLDNISVHSSYRIVTSGYTDRYVQCDSTSIAISVSVDDSGAEYVVRFDAYADAINYLIVVHGMAEEYVNNTINGAPKHAGLSWEYKGTSSKTRNIETVRQILSIMSISTKREVREQYAREAPLTPDVYYAVCTGLYRCNESNRLMKKRGLRDSYQVLVQPEGFDLDTEFDEQRVRNALIALAEDPSRCYS